VGNAAAEKRSDDAEDDCPGHRQVHMHHRPCDNPRDKPDNDIPDYVKHTYSSMVCLQLKSPESAPIPIRILQGGGGLKMVKVIQFVAAAGLILRKSACRLRAGRQIYRGLLAYLQSRLRVELKLFAIWRRLWERRQEGMASCSGSLVRS
jgi:hypothetical protein